ncbi:hypothetical protein, conserved [Eimeria praecox]|uniref:Cytadherence high molecular weight protein 2, related n=1 Tax=Eimeria praecox TaxID=51316 RepID=U6GYG0_9EIME|nr:hypothetical protein, conserved [Eimeria praecox]
MRQKQSTKSGRNEETAPALAAAFGCYGCTFGNHWDECGPGYFCPAGTHDPRSLPCPPGTYNPDRKAVSKASCLPCPVGTYCANQAQTNPDRCPPGSYCPTEGLALGIPCPPGTYNIMYLHCPPASSS